MNINQNVINFWIVGISLGFYFGGLHGAAIGLAATSCLTLFINLFL